MLEKFKIINTLMVLIILEISEFIYSMYLVVLHLSLLNKFKTQMESSLLDNGTLRKRIFQLVKTTILRLKMCVTYVDFALVLCV